MTAVRSRPIVVSRRGTEGGYRLAVPAADLTVAAVLRAVDGPITQIGSSVGQDGAGSPTGLALDRTWKLLDGRIRSLLEAVSIADLAAGRVSDPLTPAG